jgi:hypothetical protein
VLEHKVHLIFHAWGAMPLMRDGAVAGVIFESKEGRKAIRAAVTIDCTGDGDIFHRAGVKVRDVPTGRLQDALAQQGVLLRVGVAA